MQPLPGPENDERRPLLSADIRQQPLHVESATGGARHRIKATATVVALLVVFLLTSLSLTVLATSNYIHEALETRLISAEVVDITEVGFEVQIDGSATINATTTSRSILNWLGRKMTNIASTVEVGTSVTDISVWNGREYVDLALARFPSVRLNVAHNSVNIIQGRCTIDAINTEAVSGLINEHLSLKSGPIAFRSRIKASVKIMSLWVGRQTFDVFSNLQERPEAQRFKIQDVLIREGHQGLIVNASMMIYGNTLVTIKIPAFSWDLLMNTCRSDHKVVVAKIDTSAKSLTGGTAFGTFQATASISSPSIDVVDSCNNSKQSPLDALLKKFASGDVAPLFLRGSRSREADRGRTWLHTVFENIEVQVPIRSKNLGHLAREVNISSVKMHLPKVTDPLGSVPHIDGVVRVLFHLPADVHANINIQRMYVGARLSRDGQQFATIHPAKWFASESRLIGPRVFAVSVSVEDAPLNITSYNVTKHLAMDLLNNDTIIDIMADSDIDLTTCLGTFTVFTLTVVPSINTLVTPLSDQSEFYVKRFPPEQYFAQSEQLGFKQLDTLKPEISHLSVIGSSAHSLTLDAIINLNNSLPYSAALPYVNAHLSHNGLILGSVSLLDANIVPGINTFHAQALYAPYHYGGQASALEGARLLSAYVSERNTTIDISAHKDSLPSSPNLSRIFDFVNLTLEAPRLFKDPPAHGPGRGGRQSPGGSQFLERAEFHIVSSTAT